jgi:transcriptional regulator with XRE-family HTH domain
VTHPKRNAHYIRLEKGKGISDVARESGVSEDTIRDLEQGRREPAAKTVSRLCKYYGVQARDLLAYEDLRRAA